MSDEAAVRLTHTERGESGADAWGACSHEWLQLADYRAALAQATATSEHTTHERGLRFRVETACDGYAGLLETDVPAEWESESYIAGAAAAAEAIRGVLEARA